MLGKALGGDAFLGIGSPLSTPGKEAGDLIEARLGHDLGQGPHQEAKRLAGLPKDSLVHDRNLI